MGWPNRDHQQGKGLSGRFLSLTDKVSKESWRRSLHLMDPLKTAIKSERRKQISFISYKSNQTNRNLGRLTLWTLV